MYRYFIEVAYNGIHFRGSQIQGELPTVQLAINTAISTILRQPIETFGASRTDEGVHALCNMYHFDIDRKLDQKTLYRINSILPSTMAANAMYLVDNEANARFDAISRTYRYRIYDKKSPFLYERALFYPYPLDEEILHQTAPILKEFVDFTTFSKKNTQTFTNNCTIYESFWRKEGEVLEYIVCANRFLRGMVRALVGTQLQMARKGKNAEDFRAIIAAKDCSLADFSVTGNGLYLEKITYPDNYFIETLNASR